MKKDLAVLRDEVAALPQPATNRNDYQFNQPIQPATPNYFGAAAPPSGPVANAHDANDILELPTVNWDEWARDGQSPQKRRQA